MYCFYFSTHIKFNSFIFFFLPMINYQIKKKKNVTINICYFFVDQVAKEYSVEVGWILWNDNQNIQEWLDARMAQSRT